MSDKVFTRVIKIPFPNPSFVIPPGIFPPNIPAFIAAHTPASLAWFLANGPAALQDLIDTAAKLITALPAVGVRILVLLGDIPILNVQLVAKLVPTAVPLPDLALSLPSLSFSINAIVDLGLPPLIIEVPVPVPLPVVPDVAIDLPNVTTSAAIGVQ